MKLILIVEDEYGNAEILQMLLEAEGFRVALASNGKHALEMLMEGERPSLMLSDFMMPIMNGGEFGTQVRADAELRHIPFVFMSGTSEDVVQQSFEDYDAFLPKPLKLDTLVLTINQLLTQTRHHPIDDKAGSPIRQMLKD